MGKGPKAQKDPAPAAAPVSAGDPSSGASKHSAGKQLARKAASGGIASTVLRGKAKAPSNSLVRQKPVAQAGINSSEQRSVMNSIRFGLSRIKGKSL